MTREPQEARTDGERAGLDAAALAALLEFLGGPGGDGGAAFERMRQKLVGFFRWKGVRGGEGLADQVLDRVARKLAAGERVEAEPGAYVLGVARFVYLEAVKREAGERRQIDRVVALGGAGEPGEGDEAEVRLEALAGCLDRLDRADRHLVLEYHRESGAEGIARRQALAAERGVAINALRIRAHRLRHSLARCVEAHLLRNESGKRATPLREPRS